MAHALCAHAERATRAAYARYVILGWQQFDLIEDCPSCEEELLAARAAVLSGGRWERARAFARWLPGYQDLPLGEIQGRHRS